MDQSQLDNKYFTSPDTYNCPFCNRRNVQYTNLSFDVFNWSKTKTCFIWRIKCTSCEKISMHLTFEDIRKKDYNGGKIGEFKSGIELDDNFFYSVPTSFFVVDNRIPAILRGLITEAEGCSKMNYLVGAAACTRKAIYELLILNKIEEGNYDDRIKALQTLYSSVDQELFEILGHIKDMTSDHVHEQSWEAWDNTHLKLFLETLKSILHEIYVVPDEKKLRLDSVRALKQQISIAKNEKKKAAEA